MSATLPSSTADIRSWSGCSCHESGGLPPCSRVASTVRALEPPPPETAALLNVVPGAAAVNAFCNTCSASDSEPEVHHEKTSRLLPPPPLSLSADPAPPQPLAAASITTAATPAVMRFLNINTP